MAAVLFLWSDSYRVNQELKDLQNQLADINKQLDLSSDYGDNDGDDDGSQEEVPKGSQVSLTAEIEETKRRLQAAEIQLGQCIKTTADMVKEINGTKFNLSEAINKTHMEAWVNSTRDKNETTEYISLNFMSYGKYKSIKEAFRK